MGLNIEIRAEAPRQPTELHRNVLRLCKLTNAPSQLQTQLPSPIQLSLLRAFHVPITLAGGKLIAAHHTYTAHVSDDDVPAGSVDTLDLPDGESDVHKRTRAVSRRTPNFNLRASVGSDGGEAKVTWKAAKKKRHKNKSSSPTLVPPWEYLRRFLMRKPKKDKKKSERSKPTRITVGATQYGESIASYRIEYAAKRGTATIERRSNSSLSLKTRGKVPNFDSNLNLRTRTVLDFRKGKCPLKIETALNHKPTGRMLELKADMDKRWSIGVAPNTNTTLTVDSDGDVSLELDSCTAEWCSSDAAPALRVPVYGFDLRVSKRGVALSRWYDRGRFAVKAAPDDITLDARCSVRHDGILQRHLIFRASIKQGLQFRFGRFY